jgi:hypothetical protein
MSAYPPSYPKPRDDQQLNATAWGDYATQFLQGSKEHNEAMQNIASIATWRNAQYAASNPWPVAPPQQPNNTVRHVYYPQRKQQSTMYYIPHHQFRGPNTFFT